MTSLGLLPALLADLADESADLDARVAPLSDAEWAVETPAAGWTVAHQIGHLAWTDDQALLAVHAPSDFTGSARRATAALGAAVEAGAQSGATATPAELLARWRRGRADLMAALEELPAGERIPWYGPPMSASSLVTARLMETWAHGLDVADALGRPRSVTARLRHVAHLGVRTRDYSFAVHGLAPPREEYRIELSAPDGQLWTWGPDAARERVAGAALDFALLVTQRVHRDDTSLRADGEGARRWLEIAQAFAGPPGQGRPAAG